MTGHSVVTEQPRWDEESRAWEIAYTAYLDSLCECGVPRSVCMDENKVWFVDHRVGYRCRALQQVQRKFERDDAEAEKNGVWMYPQSRKWSAVEYDMTRDGSLLDGEDSSG